MKTVSILFLIFLQVATHAQDQSSGVQAYMEAVRQGNAQSTSTSFLHNKKNEKILFEEVETYLKDTLTEVRLAAYTLLAAIGKQSASTEMRQQVVSALVVGWRDVDSGVVGTIGSHLQQFKPADFTSSGKDSLRVLIQEHVGHFNKLVMLCGYLGMVDLIPALQSQLQSGLIKNKRERSAAYLALCRLGNEQAMNHILKLVEALELNDDLVYEVFPDLIYTRQRFVFEYVIKSLYNDEKNCESANPEISESIPCAYRIMELLAPVVKGFPFKVDASGDVIARNYPEALRESRYWFKKMNSNYAIISDTF